MNDLEKYLLANRDALDQAEPLDEDHLWEGVKNRMDTVSSPDSRPSSRLSHFWKRWAIAASVVALAGWGVLLFRNEDRTKSEYSLSDISPELAKEEAKFQHLIRLKEQSIGFDELDRGAYREIFQELEELEKNTEEARQDVPGFRENNRLVKTLLQHYELKIRILEHLSKEIEKKKYHEELEKSL